jgi:pSer/pThr/pTyr-binding forkhead associated (FHA) protein
MVPRPAQPSPSEKNEPRFALRFISGKYQGGEYPLAEGQEIVIGRSSELDMVLVEEMVSRKHARIALTDGTISIEDLGSTNGTFVNGEKVQQGTLREGDRVLIGTNILKVVAAPQDAEARANLKAMAVGRVTARQQQQPGTRVTEEAPRMSGNLEEIPLPDLLQLFGTSRKAGVLVLRTGGREGRIYLNDGRIRFAEFVGMSNVPPLKAVYRMLSWTLGTFALDPPDTRELEGAIDVSAQEVLMEGFRQHDELGQLRAKLPGRMALKLPLAHHLRELSDEELDTLEAALTAENLDAFLDMAPSADLESAQALQSLLQRGYLRPA